MGKGISGGGINHAPWPPAQKCRHDTRGNRSAGSWPLARATSTALLQPIPLVLSNFTWNSENFANQRRRNVFMSAAVCVSLVCRSSAVSANQTGVPHHASCSASGRLESMPAAQLPQARSPQPACTYTNPHG